MLSRNRPRILHLLSVLLICCPAYSICHAASEPDVASADLARRILAETGVSGGLIVHLGCGDGRLTAAMHVDDRYLVHGLDANRASVGRARENLLALGCYGKVSVTAFDGRHLPYADNLVNLLVASRMEDVSQELAPAHLQPMGGFLDDTYFKRYFWFYGTPMVRPVYAAMARPQITTEQMSIALSQLLVQDDTALYGMRMFDSMKLLNADNYFVPGKEGYLIFKTPPGEGDPMWTQRVPIRVTAMAVTPERLVIAGPPDIVDPDDPLGAFQSRKGGRLRVLSTSDGGTLEEHRLDSPAVFQGLAVARGRVFVSLKSGSVVCLAAARQ